MVSVLPFCPYCRTEYDDGYSLCAGCGARLVDSLPAKPEEEPVRYVSMKRMFLLSTSGSIESAMIVDILSQHGIRAFTQQKETGNYLNIYSGFSVYGEDLYVDAADYEAVSAPAREFLSPPETSVEHPKKIPDGGVHGSYWARSRYLAGVPRFALVRLLQ